MDSLNKSKTATDLGINAILVTVKFTNLNN